MADEYIRKADAERIRFSGGVNLDGILCVPYVEYIKGIKALPAADVAPVVRCKDCIHNNDCDIQYSAQAGENFFCGFGETEKDVREDIYE